jgi:hypothetical protein
MLDWRVVLLNFIPLIKLRMGVFNYITKRRRNGAHVINCTMSMKRSDLVSLKPFPNLVVKNP